MYRIQIFNVVRGISKEKTLGYIYKKRPTYVICYVIAQNELVLGTIPTTMLK